MTIVTYDVTPTHRYFMRRTKRDILDKIEQMTGTALTSAQRQLMSEWSKSDLANHAMKIVRSLPNEPR